MGLIRTLTDILLVGVLITANLALVKQAEWNGTFNLDSLLTYTNRVLPNTDIPITLPRTGIDPVDNYFAFMTSFFYATLDSRNVRAHWQGNHLLGTLSSIWMVMLLEAHSKCGSAFVGLTYFLEVMGELLGIGLFTPIWCLVHLFMTKSNERKGGKVGRSLGWGLVLGHVLPTVLMLRTQPDGDEWWKNQQIWTIVRLFHPVLLFGFVGLFPRSKNAEVSSKKMYIFSILASAFFHITSLGFLLAPTIFPGWLKNDVASALDPQKVLIPVPFWSEAVVQKVDFPTGVAVFLQWDYLCSSAAVVVWAVGLYVEAAAGISIEMMVQTLGVAVLAGPGAAAAFLMMEREGLLVDEGKKKQ